MQRIWRGTVLDNGLDWGHFRIFCTAISYQIMIAEDVGRLSFPLSRSLSLALAWINSFVGHDKSCLQLSSMVQNSGGYIKRVDCATIF